MNWKELLEQLSQPFNASDIQWRAGATTRDKKKAQALPYAEPRVYEARLDDVCPGEWHVFFKPWGDNKLICELTIFGVIRSSTGEFDSGDKISQGTTAEAQAFKRACSKFGLGRYLYEIEAPWVEYDSEKSKLAQTPTLPAKFLPRVSSAKTQAPPAPPAPARQSKDTLLTNERASAMHEELGKLGIKNHYEFASHILEREIKSLTELSEVEALEVWSAAKRQARKTNPTEGRIQDGATYEESFGRN